MIRGTYIKVVEIEQAKDVDNLIALPFSDDGVFYVRIYDFNNN